MRGILYVAFILLTGSLYGAEFSLFEPSHLSIEAHRIYNYREPYIDEYSTMQKEPADPTQTEYWTYGAMVNFNVNLVRVNNYRLFWRNTIHGESTSEQFRRVGWQWNLGFTLIPNKLELFHLHHSEHILDKAAESNVNYPVRDSYGVRMIFLDKE